MQLNICYCKKAPNLGAFLLICIRLDIVKRRVKKSKQNMTLFFYNPFDKDLFIGV